MRRFEYKYLIHRSKLPEMRRMVQPFVIYDKHARQSGGAYTVRSIYFDTPRLDNFVQKIEGIEMRRKLRVRGYDKGDADSIVFLEIKRRYGVPIAKNRAPVRFGDVPALLTGGDIERHVIDDPPYVHAREDASRFLFNLHRYEMRSIVNVCYEREAFVGRLDPSIRITFDKNLRSVMFPHLTDLYSDRGLRHVYREHFILEIKFYGAMMPVWGRTLVRRLQVHQRALSKYTNGILAHGEPPSFFEIVARAKPIDPYALTDRAAHAPALTV